MARIQAEAVIESVQVFADGDVQAGFLPGFPVRRAPGRFAGLGRAAGNTPFAAEAVAQRQQTPVINDQATGVAALSILSLYIRSQATRGRRRLLSGAARYECK